MLRRVCSVTPSSSAALIGGSLTHTQIRSKYVKMPSGEWDSVHEDLNAHVRKRVPGETRLERVKRFAREWRNVEMELGPNKDSRGREVRYRKTYVYRFTYPNCFDEHWWPVR